MLRSIIIYVNKCVMQNKKNWMFLLRYSYHVRRIVGDFGFLGNFVILPTSIQTGPIVCWWIPDGWVDWAEKWIEIAASNELI